MHLFIPQLVFLSCLSNQVPADMHNNSRFYSSPSHFVFYSIDAMIATDIIIRLPSNVTSCCVTDFKSQSPLNIGGLFCSADDGRIYAIQLGSHLCRPAVSSLPDKPVHVEIQHENVVLQLPNVLAMRSDESRLAVLFHSSSSVSVALYTVSEDCLTLSAQRIHQLYTCKEFRPTSILPVSLLDVIIPASFYQKSSSQHGCRSDVLNVSDELFNVLFGLEMNLCRCPVLLLCDHGGLVLWLPMKTIISSSVSVRVLCSLGDSLVHVLSFSVVRDHGASPSSHLALVGHHGRILVISLSSGATKTSYQHYDMLGPVQCCTSFDNSKLLYSTGNELYVADIVQSVQSSQPGSIKSSALGISGVTALSAVRTSEKNNRTALVLAAMSDDRVVELEIDSNVTDGCTRQRCQISAVQSTMSNFLSNIGQTGECLARVTLDSEAKDSVLEQLAIAGSLLQSLSASSIHCSIVASSGEFLAPHCRRIIASVSNRANFTLGRSWTFLMSVSPSSKCCSCEPVVGSSSCSKSCHKDNRSLYVSCDVSGLSPGTSESLSVMIQLDEHSSVSHIVKTALIYTPVNQVASAAKQISVPLATEVIDILDFVQLLSSSSSSSASCLQHSRQRSCFASECRKLQQLCRPQVRDDSDLVSLDELESKKKSFASVKEHVISLYASKSSNIQDLTANGLLSVLLGNVASEVGSKVNVVCPEGQTVTIEVVPCADDAYQLLLCSCDLHILIAVRLALLNRLETRAHCPVVVKPAASAAAAFQHLRSRLDDVRDSVSFGASKQMAAKQIVTLYETLRGSLF